jgi:predicted nucleic-acid-binding Zn-ribbon protein
MPDEKQIVHMPTGPEPMEHRAAQEAALKTWGVSLYADWPERVEAWLRDRWKQPCPRCGVNEWVIGDSIMALGIFATESIQPKVSVTCVHCGDTVLLNANLVGVIERQAGDEEDEP